MKFPLIKVPMIGLSGPIPRGKKCRKSKKDKMFREFEDVPSDWTISDKHDPDLKLADIGYKKHLQRQANK